MCVSRRRTLSETSKRSGEPLSIDHLASDSTGGLSASQEGMRSPIVQDDVVDAVQEARSKLANLAATQAQYDSVPNSLASYDQNHVRCGNASRSLAWLHLMVSCWSKMRMHCWDSCV